MTANPALDAAVREARYVLFSFFGVIVDTDTREGIDSVTATVPYIHDALAACRESGRSAAVLNRDSPIDVPSYLEAHGLFELTTVIAASVVEAMDLLDAPADDCLLVTSSADDIKNAQTVSVPYVSYGQSSENVALLVDAGAVTFAYSMADLALSFRARQLDL